MAPEVRCYAVRVVLQTERRIAFDDEVVFLFLFFIIRSTDIARVQKLVENTEKPSRENIVADDAWLHDRSHMPERRAIMSREMHARTASSSNQIWSK